MTAIGSTSPSATPFNLDDFIEACVANEFVNHENTILSRVNPDKWGGFYDETGKYLSESEVKVIQEQQEKQKKEYLQIFRELPPKCQKPIMSLFGTFLQVKSIADNLSEYHKDDTLKKLINTRGIEPLEAVATCAAYIDHLAEKVEACSFSFNIENCGEGSVFRSWPETLHFSASATAKHQGFNFNVPGEMYLWQGRKIYHLIFKDSAEADGSRKVCDLPNPEYRWRISGQGLYSLGAKFEQRFVNKRTIFFCDDHEIITIPNALETASFVKPFRFWEELPFEQVQEFFATLREGSDAKSILPADVVNTVIKNYIVTSSKM
jgi:hypothetical protein